MDHPSAALFDDLRSFIESFGLSVRLQDLDIETPGEFDGPTITINPGHDRTAAAYYLAHAFGSIVQWSTDFENAKKVFDDLRDVKKRGQKSPDAFEEAVLRWRKFEQTSSEYAVWTIEESSHTLAIEPYTIFFRADIEAMTVFHRTDKAPEWPEFFGEWKRQVERGQILPEPFPPRRVPPFTPVKIEKQEVVQER
jgi:hypothetical protein